MVTRIAEVDRTLARLTPTDRGAWQHWLTMHNLDPMRIPLGTQIEADDDDRTITTQYVTGFDHDTIATEIVIRQLEARPAPFPPGLPSVTT